MYLLPFNTHTDKEAAQSLHPRRLLCSCLSAHTSLLLSPHHASPTLFSFPDRAGAAAASQTKLMGGLFLSISVHFSRTHESNHSNINLKQSKSFQNAHSPPSPALLCYILRITSDFWVNVVKCSESCACATSLQEQITKTPHVFSWAGIVAPTNEMVKLTRAAIISCAGNMQRATKQL